MVEAKLLYKILGSLLIMLGLLMGGCALMAGCYQEDDIMAFLISSLFTGCCGFIFKYLGRNATNDMSRRTAYLVVTLCLDLPLREPPSSTTWSDCPTHYSSGDLCHNGLVDWVSYSSPLPFYPRWWAEASRCLPLRLLALRAPKSPVVVINDTTWNKAHRKARSVP